MKVDLPPLPYAKDALAPYISKTQLSVHYEQHHKGYVDKLNVLLDEDGVTKEIPLEEIILNSTGEVFNNAAQVYNHTFYWNSMTPEDTEPSDELFKLMDIDSIRSELILEGSKLFGSGWLWLCASKNECWTMVTANAKTPIMWGQSPLLCIDLWEHAYYLDQKSHRKKYLEGVVNNLLNWEFASDNLENIK